MFDFTKEYIKNLVKNKNLPYIDVAVNYRQESVFRYFGGKSCPNGKERLCMFSMTKPITAVLMMRLIEEGKVSLNDHVSEYIPAFKNAFYICNDKKVEADITIKHLLTMTSGLNYDLNSFVLNKIKNDSLNKATTFEVISVLPEMPLEFKPGERFLYGLSFDVLGAVIERILGERFSDCLYHIIFEPLGMFNSTIKFNKNVPDVFVFDEKDGICQAVHNAYYNFMITSEFESGGAGLISTVEDYMLFAETLACGGVSKKGYRLLSKESIDLMSENHISDISVNNSFSCIQGDEYAYGFGVRTRTIQSKCGVPVGEFGWDGAAGSYLLVDRKNNISIVIGLNVLNWPSFFKGEHLQIVEKIYSELL